MPKMPKLTLAELAYEAQRSEAITEQARKLEMALGTYSGAAEQFLRFVESKKAPSKLGPQGRERLVWYSRNQPPGSRAENTVESGLITYTNVRDLLAYFFIEAHLKYGAPGNGFNWRSFCIGITSKVFLPREGVQGHMPIFDYDGQNIKRQIRGDVKDLQAKYGLGPAWVYETRKGFHVYFFCDVVDLECYLQMLQETKCCKGFRQVAKKRCYGTLRVSAKYTDFDIKPVYVLPPKDKVLKRLTRKGHLVQALLELGEKCGTHFASLFPQWASYTEDPQEWKPPASQPAGKGKRIRKIKAIEPVATFSVEPEPVMYQSGATTITTTSSGPYFVGQDGHWYYNK